MKTTTTRLMIATALLALSTGAAFAQAFQAEIPFAFRVGKKVMAPGTYRVLLTDMSQNVLVLSNYASKDSVIAIPTGTDDPSKAWKAKGNAVLSFGCDAGRCELNQIWNGLSAPVYNLPHHKLSGSEHAVATLIHLARANGD